MAAGAKHKDEAPSAVTPPARVSCVHDGGRLSAVRGRTNDVGDRGVEPRRVASDMQDQCDEDLLALVGAGDRQAYHILVERHGRRVLAMARRMTGNLAEAEDVAQDAFLRVWQHAADWRDKGARFTTWLYRVVMNLCLDRRRRAPMAPLEVAGDPIDSRPSAEAALAAGQRAALVTSALGALSDRQRAALVLSYYEGLSNAAAADVLAVSVEALESLLARARRALRVELEKRGVIAVEMEEP